MAYVLNSRPDFIKTAVGTSELPRSFRTYSSPSSTVTGSCRPPSWNAPPQHERGLALHTIQISREWTEPVLDIAW